MGRILLRKHAMQFPGLRIVGGYMEGLLLQLFWLLVGRVSPARASIIGKKLFHRLGPKTHKHKRLKRNLGLAFSDLNDRDTEALARDVWENFGAVLAEYPHLAKIGAGDAALHIEQVIDRASRPILEDRRPAVYVSAHLANWELVAALLTTKGIPLSAVYGPQGNPVLEALIQGRRRSSGCRFVAKTHALAQLIREIHAGRSVGLLSDQRVDSGEAVRFFGREAPTTTSPAWLAMKLNCPLVPVQVERIGDAHYRVTFHTPLLTGCEPADPDRMLKATTELNALFEQWIRRRPEQWLCLKRRWPEAAYSAE